MVDGDRPQAGNLTVYPLIFRLHGKQTNMSSFFLQPSCQYYLKRLKRLHFPQHTLRGRNLPAPSAKPISIFLEGPGAVMFPGSLCFAWWCHADFPRRLSAMWAQVHCLLLYLCCYSVMHSSLARPTHATGMAVVLP